LWGNQRDQPGRIRQPKASGTFLDQERFLMVFSLFSKTHAVLLRHAHDLRMSVKDGTFHSDAGVGITAWWQLQHQHNYAPLVTRIILEKTLEVQAV
jgi:hypothetical protein